MSPSSQPQTPRRDAAPATPYADAAGLSRVEALLRRAEPFAPPAPDARREAWLGLLPLGVALLGFAFALV